LGLVNVSPVVAYTTYTAPTGKIELTDGEKWAHIDDTDEWCSVRVYDTEDKDKCGGEVLTGNYYDKAHFFGGTKGYCYPEWHASNTKWYATSTGQTCLTAHLVDKSDEPDPEADDANTTITLGSDPSNGHFCAGFTVKVEFSVNGAFSLSGITVEEGETASPWQHTFWTSWVTVGQGTPGSAQVTDNDYLHIQLDFKTTPSDASPRDNIKAKVDWRPKAYWEWEISDSDWIDEEGDYVGFSVGLSEVVAATFNWSWELEDAQEGLIAGDWAYCSEDGIGGDRDPDSGSPLWEDESGDYSEASLPHAGRGSLTGTEMRKTSGAGYVSKQKGHCSDSTYTINLGLKAIGTDADDYAKGRTKWGSCYFYINEVTY